MSSAPASTSTQPAFGALLRRQRLHLADHGRGYSLRKVATQVDIEPSYLSKIERGLESPPGEPTIRRLAAVLELSPYQLLALANKIPAEWIDLIRRQPDAFADLLEALRGAPPEQVTRLARQVRDGHW